jgi:D-alanyl-lipoteichoic acid acyltransferase DltB (MBOAT superfamily)
MQFISLGFLIFLPVVAMINYVVPRKYRYIWLLVTSLAFYISVDVKSTAVMAASIVTTYAAGLMLEKKPEKGKLLFVLTLCVNIGLWMVFKYLGFFTSLIHSVKTVSIVAPLGISFYMLKALGYLVDVKRGDIKAERNFLKYALFVSFFPQIVAGPIERSRNMLPQFSYPLTVDFYRLRYGLMEMLWGYFMKMVVADRLAIYVNSIYEGRGSGTLVFIGTIFYTFEIYCDFCGYSFIAIGAARILGIDVMKNFDTPFLSRSIAEFWRRWHISLSSWFRDYLYIPLGGNRKGTFRKYLNILIVFAVSGLWHGASYTFIVWGLIHGIYQVLGAVLKPVRDFLVKLFGIDRNSYTHIAVKTFITFMLFSYSMIFFRAESIGKGLEVLLESFSFEPWVLTNGDLFKLDLDGPNMLVALLGIAMIIMVDMANYKGIVIKENLLKCDWWFRWVVLLGTIVIIAVLGVWGPGYDATNFIYQQF